MQRAQNPVKNRALLLYVSVQENRKKNGRKLYLLRSLSLCVGVVVFCFSFYTVSNIAIIVPCLLALCLSVLLALYTRKAALFVGRSFSWCWVFFLLLFRYKCSDNISVSVQDFRCPGVLFSYAPGGVTIDVI